MNRKKAEVPKRMTVWLNIYDDETDEYAREIFTSEYLALGAAGPNAHHVAIPCTLIPVQVGLASSITSEEIK